MNRLPLIAISGGLVLLVSESSAQSIPPDFPRGVKRVWYSFGGKQQEFVIVDVIRGQSVTVAPDLTSTQRGTSQWGSLHPFDRAWLENAFLWGEQQNALAGNASTNVVPVPVNPDRTLIGGPALSEFYGGAASSRHYLVALYLWWWHELGFLEIEPGKDPQDQLKLLMKKVDDSFKREESLNLYQAADFEKALRDLFAELHPENGGFSFLRSEYLCPEFLHHHTRGVDLTLLGVWQFARGQKYVDLVAVIDVSETGRIEFIHRGNRVVGQLIPVTSAHRSYRDFIVNGRMWNKDPVAWEIQILNENLLPLDYQKGETQFFVDATNRLPLWVVHPSKYTAKQFVGTPAPPVPAMPVTLPDPGPQEKPKPVTTTKVDRDQEFFLTRRKVGRRTTSRTAFVPALRTWKDLGGRTIEARFVDFERSIDGSLLAIVATAGGKASLSVSQLSPADVVYLNFVLFDRRARELPPLRSGSLTYLLESAKAGGFEIKIHYGNLRCRTTVRMVPGARQKDEEDLLEKARDLVLGEDEYRLDVDYPLFAYRASGANAPNPLTAEDLIVNLPGATLGKPEPDDFLALYRKADSSEHLGLPCRVMLDLEKPGLSGPGFTGAGKVAAFSTEESMFVWKILCNDPNVPGSSLLQSLKPFAEKWYEGGVIPMDVRMTHKLDPEASVRLQLTGNDFTTGAPEFSID